MVLLAAPALGKQMLEIATPSGGILAGAMSCGLGRVEHGFDAPAQSRSGFGLLKPNGL